MKVISLSQRSREWLLWRNGGIGSSDAAALFGLSPWKSLAALTDEKVTALRGGSTPDVSNSAMRRGRNLEPFVASWWEDFYGMSLANLCGEHDEHPFVRASFDGVNLDHRLAVEIKAPNRLDHEEALAGRVPEKYIMQCRHQLLVGVGAIDALHYVSYSNYFPRSKQYAVVVVRASQEDLDDLLDVERQFWADVERQAQKTT